MEYKDMSENILNRREIDQLKEMLEEKDRHIGDLTDTLTHFHVRHYLVLIRTLFYLFCNLRSRMISRNLSTTHLFTQRNKCLNLVQI